MRKAILNLIGEYTLDRKIADREFVLELFDIVVKGKELGDFVEKPDFQSKYTSTLYPIEGSDVHAEYNTRTKAFIVYNSAFDVSECSKYDKYYNGIERIMSRNLLVAQRVLHDIMHVEQRKIDELGSEDQIKGDLIKNSLYIGGKEFHMDDARTIEELTKYIQYAIDALAQYHELYDFNPTERLADIESYELLLESLEPIREEIPELYKFYSLAVPEYMIRGFARSINYGMPPSEKFLTDMGLSEVWQGFDFYDPNREVMLENAVKKHSLKKRLSLGLPITKEELKCEYNKLKESPKYRKS